MEYRKRHFWELLLTIADQEIQKPLTCDECFAILEYLAQEAIDGVPDEFLIRAVKQHIELCPDCREHHLRRLTKLEEQLSTRDGR